MRTLRGVSVLGVLLAFLHVGNQFSDQHRDQGKDQDDCKNDRGDEQPYVLVFIRRILVAGIAGIVRTGFDGLIHRAEVHKSVVNGIGVVTEIRDRVLVRFLLVFAVRVALVVLVVVFVVRLVIGIVKEGIAVVHERRVFTVVKEEGSFEYASSNLSVFA